MHSTTCESYLESVATDCEGVAAAEASYVTETVRVDYDPDRVSESALCEWLSGTGYTAVPREDAPIDSDAATAGDRRADSVLGYRYAIGVLFGSFLLLSYVVVFYPAHLSALLGDGVLPWFAAEARLEPGSGLLMLRLFAGFSGIVLLFTGMPLLRGAYVSLTMRQPTTELLTSITVVGAFLYSTVALPLGRTDVFFDLTVVIAAVVVAAMFYESAIKQRAVDRLRDRTISHIEEARRYQSDEATTMVPVEHLEAGDRILVRQGERIPVDGVLLSDECTVNEAVVTGESLPTVKREGDAVVGGSLVVDGAAVVGTDADATSSVDQLMATVWDLQSAEHGVHRLANRLAAWAIPAVVLLALAAGGVALGRGDGPLGALLTGLTAVLAVSPWALGLATPLSVATIIDDAMERGIIVFDETIFERMRNVDVVVFDKTGTLTTGQMSVLEADAPAELLAAAVRLERRASHPVAEAIADAFGDSADRDAPPGADGAADPSTAANGDAVQEFRTYSDGVAGVVGETEVLVGEIDRFGARGWTVSEALARRVQETRGVGRVPVVVGRDGRAEGLIVVGDEPREQWDETLTRLGARDVDVVVLTGDDDDAAAFFGRQAHVDHVFADVPPAGKTAAIRRLQAEGDVAMVGDGTNDAPALAKADVGISVGSGTAVAADAADLALATDDLATVETAFDLARSARRRVTQNTALSGLYNVIAIPLAAAGLFNPLLVMGAVGLTSGLLAANSARPLIAD